MSLSRRHRASFVLLLVLAAGLAAAGGAAAASTQEMACCPAGMETAANCAWLGAGDCCPERLAAPAPSHAAAPAPASGATLISAALAAAPVALPACASHAQRTPRSAVLRL